MPHPITPRERAAQGHLDAARRALDEAAVHALTDDLAARAEALHRAALAAGLASTALLGASLAEMKSPKEEEPTPTPARNSWRELAVVSSERNRLLRRRWNLIAIEGGRR